MSIFKKILLAVAVFFASMLFNIIIMSAIVSLDFDKGITTGLPTPSDSTGNPLTLLSGPQTKGTAYLLVDPPSAPTANEGSISATQFFYQPDPQYYFDLDQESKIMGLCMQRGRQIDDPANTECGTETIRYVSETDNDLNLIQNVANPTNCQDAATKKYVDDIVAGIILPTCP